MPHPRGGSAAATAETRCRKFFVGTAPGVDLMDGFRSVPGMALPEKGKLVPSDAPGFGIELTLGMIEAAL